MKRKLAMIFAGSAVLGTLAFAPAAFAQDTVIVDRPVTSGSTTVVTPAPDSSAVVVEPNTVVAAAPQPQAFESQYHYGFAAARQPGSVPSPYSDRPSSGHIGDEFYYKQFGGVSPP
ncbi:MAG TPA: hypothetical protein VI319_15905 [Burkholderiales bacterium]